MIIDRMLGIDTGGTFTDFVYFAGRRVHILKVLSTPDAPERAILHGIRESVAINLLYSVVDDQFEKKIAAALPQDLFISCSSAVLPEQREQTWHYHLAECLCGRGWRWVCRLHHRAGSYLKHLV